MASDCISHGLRVLWLCLFVLVQYVLTIQVVSLGKEEEDLAVGGTTIKRIISFVIVSFIGNAGDSSVLSEFIRKV
jgi:hypothetical protein